MFAYKITGDLSYECVEITQEEIKDYPSPQWYVSETPINWTTHMYVNGEIKERPVVPPDPPITPIPPTKDQLLQQLDWEYQPQFLELSRSWADATMEGKTELANSIAADRLALKQEYEQKRGEING